MANDRNDVYHRALYAGLGCIVTKGLTGVGGELATWKSVGYLKFSQPADPETLKLCWLPGMECCAALMKHEQTRASAPAIIGVRTQQGGKEQGSAHVAAAQRPRRRSLLKWQFRAAIEKPVDTKHH